MKTSVVHRHATRIRKLRLQRERRRRVTGRVAHRRGDRLEVGGDDDLKRVILEGKGDVVLVGHLRDG